MKTLMATDGSHQATTALRAAIRLLRRRDNEIHILCVAPEFYELGTQKSGKRVRDEYKKRIARETQTILERARETLLAEGVTAETRAETGSPAKAIVRLADDYNVTVLGATSQYDTTRPGIGSVASRVVEHAPGIVLVCREPGGGIRLRILLCVDGSRASRHALGALTSYLNTDSAEITLMHVVETPWVNLGLDQDWFDQGGETREQRSSEIRLQEELQSEANEILDDAAEQLTRHGLDATTVIAEGNPATEILGQAEQDEYDLIVLGASGATDMKHRMLGSVSAKVTGQAPCSVAVVK
ncbi:MAG TPA: universal stress protein [Pyrinomonadaceae bacterium]|nr:universal stress protein [Pyrinomonadaceae bacterium]